MGSVCLELGMVPIKIITHHLKSEQFAIESVFKLRRQESIPQDFCEMGPLPELNIVKVTVCMDAEGQPGEFNRSFKGHRSRPHDLFGLVKPSE